MIVHAKRIEETMERTEEVLRDMVAEAKTKDCLIYCHYQGIWWTPKEFEAQLDMKKFLWGIENFKLRNKEDKIRSLIRARDDAQRELDSWRARLDPCRFSEQAYINDLENEA